MRLAKEDGEEPVNTRLVKVAFTTVRFVIAPVPANKDVDVTLVVVTLVNTPVDGDAFPIGVLLIDPPEITAFEEAMFAAFKVAIVELVANNVVPEAVAKPNHAVDVPLVKVRFEMVPFVMLPVVAKRLVVVTAVAVALPTFAFQRKAEVPRASVASKLGIRSVEIRPLTAKFVVVTFVAVAFVRVVA
jgi:hypothetical protein